MSDKTDQVYPYIPNSVPAIRREMLDFIGVEDVEELFRAIPPELRLDRPLDLPEPFLSEHDLKTHVEELLAKNISCNEVANFLGAGCYQHFIPAVCDEINSRGEFLTAYAGDTYSDHGKHQAWFEFQSLLAELIEMDVVGFPTYDWSAAASSALLMAARLTDRGRVIVPKNLNPDKLLHMRNFCKASLDDIIQINYHPDTGQLDLHELKASLNAEIAAVYFENPSYFGIIESQGEQIARLAHEAGARVVVGVDPISLGVLTPPSRYGADLVCGDAQTLGVHMLAGTGSCGFIASHADLEVMAEFPTLFETIGTTAREGEWGFGWATMDRTSFDKRDASSDFTGTSTGLWAITAAVYMATLGPQGIRDVNEAILQKTYYTMNILGKIAGVRVLFPNAPVFREFVVNFDDTGQRVAEINRGLLNYGVFGGRDLSGAFPELGQSALYCVTEVTSLNSIRKLAGALKELLS